jgi:hypothetical protein
VIDNENTITTRCEPDSILSVDFPQRALTHFSCDMDGTSADAVFTPEGKHYRFFCAGSSCNAVFAKFNGIFRKLESRLIGSCYRRTESINQPTAFELYL